MQDPLPGHETHQIVIALPLGDDGKIYSGQVTYSASKLVQVVVLNPFNATATDEEHLQPLNASFGNGSIAISLMDQLMKNLMLVILHLQVQLSHSIILMENHLV